MLNDFCNECAGQDSEDVINCEFEFCPFFDYRAANLPWQEKRKEQKE